MNWFAGKEIRDDVESIIDNSTDGADSDKDISFNSF